MREILFRGKRVDNGEWVYGNYVKEKVRHFITQPLENSHRLIEIIPDTVGQYTEQTDKNGKKIFEGDIILIGEKRRKVEVIFLNGRFGYLHKTSCINFQNQSPEIIGNIFDKDKI